MAVKLDAIRSAADRVAASHGLDVVDVELTGREKERILRVTLEKNAEGRMAITKVELHPKLKWGGDKTPSAEELDKMHHLAHEQCFIANSVKTEVTVVK